MKLQLQTAGEKRIALVQEGIGRLNRTTNFMALLWRTYSEELLPKEKRKGFMATYLITGG